MNTDVMKKTRFVFVSNYLNHHQIPFCDAMYRLWEGSFAFVQTETMEQERVQMGWGSGVSRPYLKLYYEEPAACRTLIAEAEIVLFGGCDDESYIEERLEQGRPVIRNSERLYKTGQWKAVSPRGLKKKYHDHTRHRRAPVYLLCAGAYVPSDFSIVRAYPGKMFCWGYFPETKKYDVEKLLAGKGEPKQGESGEPGDKRRIPRLLWAARMIDWKHPELPLETARYLKEKGHIFHMDIIGGGDMEERVKAMRTAYGLENEVNLPGFMPPEQVRAYMERADIFLITSDRQEGWGAVVNEAMNSACAVLADHMVGAVPYLIEDGENGLIYRDGDREELFTLAEKLVTDRELCARLGRRAYQTIVETWNAENAAEALTQLCGRLGITEAEQSAGGMVSRAAEDTAKEGQAEGGRMAALWEAAPCAPAPVIAEGKMYDLLKRKGRKEDRP